jgi:hypothetical protein
MSFAENLHDRFELVHLHSISLRKGMSDLISFSEEKAAVEDSYGKGLKRVVKSPYLISIKEL